jgi:hypothetical protein
MFPPYEVEHNSKSIGNIAVYLAMRMKLLATNNSASYLLVLYVQHSCNWRQSTLEKGTILPIVNFIPL